MTEYKDKLSSFAARLKTEQPKTPIQEVIPIVVIAKSKDPETQLNIWIPKSLMKNLKKHSIENDKTIKDFVIEAISKYIER